MPAPISGGRLGPLGGLGADGLWLGTDALWLGTDALDPYNVRNLCNQDRVGIHTLLMN